MAKDRIEKSRCPKDLVLIELKCKDCLGTPLVRPGNRGGLVRWYSKSTMADTTHDPRVDSYIDSLPDWQQGVCRRVRALVHTADPEVTETIKRTDRPYFVLQGNVCALLAAKDHVNVFLYDPVVPIWRASSPRVTKTRRDEPWPSIGGRRSTRRRSSLCFGPSLRITGSGAGVRSCASIDPLEPAPRTLVALIRRQVAEADGHSCKGEEVNLRSSSSDS